MSIQNKCIKCDCPLKCGKFAYKQEICWDCFAQITRDILKFIDTTPSWTDKSGFKDHINHMMAIVAEVFWEEWHVY